MKKWGRLRQVKNTLLIVVAFQANLKPSDLIQGS
uniref:Uncharacterized protein n=1 Tax=Cyanothece sp. (strain PCC 7425 / ATCC 29141) TaxID=395961 RepID=B8HSX8_CYAP4